MTFNNIIKNKNKKENEMAFNTNIADENIKKELGLTSKPRAMTMSDEIMCIFKEAKEAGRTELSLNEITAAYYNMFTKPNNGSLKKKNRIAQQLFNMRKKQASKYDVEMIPGKQGRYRLRHD